MDLLNLTKEESLNLLDLRKDKVLELNLNKPSLQNHRARVAVVMDYSGSMSSYFKNGTVQAIIERIFPIALNFDDNGAMDVWIFEDGYRRLPEMTKENYYGYVKTQILDKRYRMGGTKYAPVMKDVGRKYLEEDPQQLPNYVIFITDGDNFDKRETTAEITELANYPIFWQFVGIGSGEDNFPYLQKLDDLPNRYVDNADFFSVSNTSDFYTHDMIYQALLNEYPGWLENPRVKDMIANKYSRGLRTSSTNTPNEQPKKKGFFGLF